jgi:hypothetical protein
MTAPHPLAQVSEEQVTEKSPAKKKPTKKSPAKKKPTKKIPAKKATKKSPAKKKAASKKVPRWKRHIGQRGGIMVVGDKLKSRMVRIDVRFADIITKRAKKAEQSVTDYTRDWASKLS